MRGDMKAAGGCKKADGSKMQQQLDKKWLHNRGWVALQDGPPNWPLFTFTEEQHDKWSDRACGLDSARQIALCTRASRGHGRSRAYLMCGPPFCRDHRTARGGTAGVELVPERRAPGKTSR